MTNEFLVVRILVYVVHLYVVTLMAISVSLALVQTMTYLYFLTNFFVKELCIGRFEYRALDDFRIMICHDNVSCVYREFQVLHSYVINVWGPIIAFAHFSCTVVPVYGAILVLSSRGKANAFVLLFMALMFVGIVAVWLMTLELGKYLYVQGRV